MWVEKFTAVWIRTQQWWGRRESCWICLQLCREWVEWKGWMGRSRDRKAKGQKARSPQNMAKKKTGNKGRRKGDWKWPCPGKREALSKLKPWLKFSSVQESSLCMCSINREKNQRHTGVRHDPDPLCSFPCISSWTIWLREIIFLMSLQGMDTCVSVCSVPQ